MIRVLIVEDDPMVAQVCREYLHRILEQAEVQLFGDGQSALAALRRDPAGADLIILDQYMPCMTGNELLRHMHTENLRGAVIMVTSATEATMVEEALRYGAVDYLIKPFSFARFQEAIQRFLAKTQLLKSAAVLDQAAVDQLLGSTGGTQPDLQKGLNQKTLDRIHEYLRTQPEEEHTCKSISAAVNLSNVTVRRYLNYLIETNRVRSSIDYETGGRPRVLYHLR